MKLNDAALEAANAALRRMSGGPEMHLIGFAPEPTPAPAEAGWLRFARRVGLTRWLPPAPVAPVWDKEYPPSSVLFGAPGSDRVLAWVTPQAWESDGRPSRMTWTFS